MKPLRNVLRTFVAVAVFAITAVGSAHAQWSPFPAVNTPVCLESHEQVFPTTVSDGAGGVYITWFDGRQNLYAQRLDANGVKQWAADGVPLALGAGYEYYGVPAVSDGLGGLIAVWQDFRNGKYDIFAQRLNAAGTALWTAGGVPVCVSAGPHELPTIAGDGSGGALITWRDGRDTLFHVFAQRLNPFGTALWTVNGVAISTLMTDEDTPVIASDGAGGAIVAWRDNRVGRYDIYAQRVNAAGAVQWAVNGVPVCTAAPVHLDPTILADGAGGAVISWSDFRSGNYDLYAQRVNGAGTMLWTPQGMPVCTAAGAQVGSPMVAGSGGRTIIVWRDLRTSGDTQAFAQLLTPAGAALWTINGVQVFDVTSVLAFAPIVTTDKAGGAIVAWPVDVGAGLNISMQRLSPSGARMWAAGGTLACTASDMQTFASHGGDDLGFRAIAPDGKGGAIVTFEDHRFGGGEDLYAQRIRSDGTLGGGTVSVGDLAIATRLVVSPNPARDRVWFCLPAGATHMRVEVIDLAGRLVRTLDPAPEVVWDGRTSEGHLVPGGVYWARVPSDRGAALERFVWLR